MTADRDPTAQIHFWEDLIPVAHHPIDGWRHSSTPSPCSDGTAIRHGDSPRRRHGQPALPKQPRPQALQSKRRFANSMVVRSWAGFIPMVGA
jgi:hypothetical protein